jgi:hypothetical protein
VTTLYSDYNNHQLNDAFLNEVAKTGIALVPWVEDDPARIRQLLADPAIVGVITDDVAAAAKARKEIR